VNAGPHVRSLAQLRERADNAPAVRGLSQLQGGGGVVQRLGDPLFESLVEVGKIKASYEDWKGVDALHTRLTEGHSDNMRVGQEDAEGLDALAEELMAAYDPDESIYVSIGASADLVTTYMRQLRPDDVTVRWLPISAVNADHQILLEYTNPNVKKDSQRAFKRKKFERLAAYVDNALRLQGTDKEIILLDATDEGNTQLLLKGLVEYLYPGLTVRPVSLSRSGHGGLGGNRFNGTSIELLNPSDEARHFMGRIHQKFFKTFLGRSFDKTDIDDLLNNEITSPNLSEQGQKSIDLFAAITQYIQDPDSMDEAERKEIEETLEFADL